MTRALVPRARDELARDFDLAIHDAEAPPPRGELLAAVRGAAGLVTILGDRVDAELLDAAGPALRVVANHAVGVDNVDLAAARARGVVVANTPDVLTRATAEFTLALLLALARRVVEGDRRLRRRERWQWAPTFMLGAGLSGRTLGVVGRGRIGGEVARLAEAFGMRVVHASRGGGLPLDRLLAESDVVTLHCPLTPETRHLIGARALGLMRPAALLVNAARGPVVDEEALVRALEAGRLGGAALDVFEREPEVHPRLRELENVVLAPHLGSATREAREAMGLLCAGALRAVLLEGRLPPNVVAAG
ncbi:MAG TPA: D-glycerate dehydrogenase [Polyangiaceae bacterium]|nr:D-glycerate dehydrogenase [Polyangiaceae bacterium]